MQDSLDSRKGRLFKNGLYSALSWIFPLILAIAVTPVIVKGLGNEMYGLYAVILGFISYSFTFGIGKAAAKFVSEFRASGNDEKISEMVSSIFWLSLSFATVGTVVVFLLARPIVVDVLLISPAIQNEAVTALYLACATIIVTMLSQVYQFVLQGLHRFDRYLLLANLSGLFLNLGSVAIVLSGYGVVALLIWNFVVAAAMGLMFYLSATRFIPNLNLTFKIGPNMWRPVIKYAISIIGYQVFGNLLFLFERAWIVRKFGAEALTFYVVPMMLGIYMHLFIGSLVLALFPVVNELLTDLNRLVRLYETSSKIIITLVAFFVVTFAVGGRMFLSLWMSPEFAAVSYQILVIHLVTFGVLSMNTLAWQITESFRAAWLNAMSTFAWMLIAIPLMITLSNTDVTGVAAARLIGVAVFLPLIWYVERRFLSGSRWPFWLSTLSRVFLACLAAGALEWLILSQFDPSWAVFAAAAVIGFGTYCTLLYISGLLNSEEKTAFLGLIARFR